jgi:hypothetical protein
MTERYRRRDVGHMEVQLTLDDPEIYARPWTVTVPLELVVDTEMLEYFCPENEKDRQRMDAKGPELLTTPVAVGTLATYTGTYDFKDDGGRPHVVKVKMSNGELFWNQDGVGAQKLLPFSDRAFSLSGWHVTFVTDGQGAITHFVGQAAEGETRGVRRR